MISTYNHCTIPTKLHVWVRSFASCVVDVRWVKLRKLWRSGHKYMELIIEKVDAVRVGHGDRKV